MSNTLDFSLVVFSLIEMIFLNDPEQKNDKSNKSVASSFKILRILRILKLIRSWHSFRIMILSIINTVKRMGNYFILLFIFIYIYALMACNVFKGSLRFNKKTNKFDINAEDLFDNFDSFTSAFLNVFYLIIGDNWNSMFYDCLRSEANNPYITIVYFISLILIGQLCMLNIFLAFLIDNFKLSRQELFKNIDVKDKVLSSFPKIGLERHRSELVRFHQKNKFKSPFLALVRFFAGEYDKSDGPNILLQSKFNFEAKIKISFRKEGKVNHNYFKRQRINNKVIRPEAENNKFDRTEDFEILYKTEAFYCNVKRDLFIDFEYIINMEMWKKDKLIDLIDKKHDEDFLFVNGKDQQQEEIDLKNIENLHDNNKYNRNNNNFNDLKLNSNAASSVYDFNRNKTDLRTLDKEHNRTRLDSFGMISRVNKEKSFIVFNNNKLNNNKLNENNFRKVKSLIHYALPEKKLYDNVKKKFLIETNHYNLNNKNLFETEIKDHLQPCNNNSSKNLVKIIRMKNQSDFQD